MSAFSFSCLFQNKNQASKITEFGRLHVCCHYPFQASVQIGYKCFTDRCGTQSNICFWVIFIPNPKKGNAKECSDYHTIALISHNSKLKLQILQGRLQQYVKHELPDVQVGFRKFQGTRDQIANICWIIEKAREFQKNIYFCFVDYTKAFDCVDHNQLWKILKEIGISDHLSTC